mgnify:CR=1 FL=1
MAKYAGKERVVHAMVEYDSDGERVLSEEERYVAKQIGRARENEPSKYPVLRWHASLGLHWPSPRHRPMSHRLQLHRILPRSASRRIL